MNWGGVFQEMPHFQKENIVVFRLHHAGQKRPTARALRDPLTFCWEIHAMASLKTLPPSTELALPRVRLMLMPPMLLTPPIPPIPPTNCCCKAAYMCWSCSTLQQKGDHG